MTQAQRSSRLLPGPSSIPRVVDVVLDELAPIRQGEAASPYMRRGFLVTGPVDASLQPLQSMAVDPDRGSFPILAARYRIGRSPLWGTLLAALSLDLVHLKESDDATLGTFEFRPSRDEWVSMLARVDIGTAPGVPPTGATLGLER